MKAEEIAKQIVERFTHNGTVNWGAAKKDAHIHCDLMVEQLQKMCNNPMGLSFISMIEYYNLEVRSKINKL